MSYIKILILLVAIGTNMHAKQTHKYTNSLINEQSPYLLQHAHNPVNWHPWNKDVLEMAKKENKLIFLSIGYSTCHWCHVMEEESFENEEIAKLLNDNYIAIKVDREEMPHIDQYYQNVYQMLNQRGGGWPLNIILTPDKKPFFATTYIPPVDKYEYMGIKKLLLQISTDFVKQKDKIIATSTNIAQAINNSQNNIKQTTTIDLSLIDKFIFDTQQLYDEENHGIGISPKFPHSSSIETMLDIYIIFKNKTALDMATNMLSAMANGGIYDQIEGGFYRYSVDRMWQIPHFEKMLYTNAELLSAYSKAYVITQNKLYKKIAKEIISFVEKRFENDGVFYGASDADSLYDGKKQEGAYYVFKYNETKDFLQKKGIYKKQALQILDYFNINKSGNFENNTNNPYLNEDKKLASIKQIKKILTKLRSKKPYPFIDKKILTSWNAMFIASLFDARVINDSYGKRAIYYLDTLLNKMYINNKLYHQTINNKKPKIEALFEDYAFLINALLKAYDYNLDKKYLSLSTKLTHIAINEFYKNKKWYMNKSNKNENIQVASDIYDSAYKSATSVMVDNIFKIALLNEDLNMQKIATDTINTYSLNLKNNSSSSPWFLRDFIAMEKGYISIKALKNKLKNKQLPMYPFVLKKDNPDKLYLACKIGKCFAFGNDFEVIKQQIIKEINTKYTKDKL